MMRYRSFILFWSVLSIVLSQTQGEINSEASTLSCAGLKCLKGCEARKTNGKTPACECVFPACGGSRNAGPLCTKDGDTLRSLCELRELECTSGRRIHVKHFGTCASALYAWHAHECEDATREHTLGMCEMWMRLNACTLQKDMMRRYCPKSCGMCQPDTWRCGKDDRDCSKKKCKDGAGKCERLVKFCAYKHHRSIMRRYCPLTCAYCG